MLKVETWPVGRFVPYARNPRKNDEQVSRMVGAIREFGFRIPIVARSDGTVIDGHLRLKAAIQLGMTEVPVALADELTDAQVKAFRILANQSANWADWDDELLKLELTELQELDFDLEMTGFDQEDLASFLDDSPITGQDDDPDKVPDIQENEPPITQVGDIWIMGKHRLACGDSTDAKAVALLMEDDRADMIFTDPPYNVDLSNRNAFLNSIAYGDRNQTPIENDNCASDEEAGEKLWKPAFQNMRDFAKDCCSIYCTMPQGGAHMMMMMASASWQVKHELIWVKNNHVLGRADYNYQHELILYGWNKTHKFYGGGKFKSSLWEIPKSQSSKLHPTMKPVELIENALMDASQAENIILDLFGGSGSTLIACEQTNRQCRMMELSPHYCDVIIRRWQEFAGGKAIRKVDGKHFDKLSGG